MGFGELEARGHQEAPPRRASPLGTGSPGDPNGLGTPGVWDPGPALPTGAPQAFPVPGAFEVVELAPGCQLGRQVEVTHGGHRLGKAGWATPGRLAVATGGLWGWGRAPGTNPGGVWCCQRAWLLPARSGAENGPAPFSLTGCFGSQMSGLMRGGDGKNHYQHLLPHQMGFQRPALPRDLLPPTLCAPPGCTPCVLGHCRAGPRSVPGSETNRGVGLGGHRASPRAPRAGAARAMEPRKRR